MMRLVSADLAKRLIYVTYIKMYGMRLDDIDVDVLYPIFHSLGPVGHFQNVSTKY